MERQLAGNAALRALRAEGALCGKCGGRNDVPDDGSVQVACRFCGAVILLADHADASAVARSRLKQNVYAMRDELVRKQAARQRKVNVAVGVIVALVVLLIGLGALGLQLAGR